MNNVSTQLRASLVWMAPAAVLALVILWQIDWGRAVHREPPSDAPLTPQPITLSILPEYVPGTLAANAQDAVERTLFNPTRRPAPSAAAEDTAEVKSKMERGQFALTGTLMVDGKATAFLRETAGGKARHVAAGETINGMTVAEIHPDRVRFALGDESEEIVLKVAAGPKTTIQPAAPNAGGSAAGAGAGAARTPPVNQAAPGGRNAANATPERRPFARPLGARRPPPQGAPGGAPPAGGEPLPTTSEALGELSQGDPRWQALYQQYHQNQNP